MLQEDLYAFYEQILLPQFGIENNDLKWQKSTETGPDEMAHFFSTSTHNFILIFEDYDGLGRDATYIKEELNLKPDEYTFVAPKIDSTHPPSLHLAPQTPYKYTPNITGSFTLLKLSK